MRATLCTLGLIAASMSIPPAAQAQTPAASPGSTIEASPTPRASVASGRRPQLGGRYTRVSDSPFAPKASVGVWTGQVALITDTWTGRTLAYDPASDRWVPLARSPARIEQVWPVWTGDRMILVGDLADDGGIETWAYTLATDSWSKLTDGPLPGHLASLAWQAGTLAARISQLPDDVGIIDADRFAILDEPGRSWRAIESPASTDAALLGVAGHIVGVAPRQAQVLDPLTGTWSASVATPVDIRGPGLVVGDRVLFLPFATSDGGTGGWSFDPATMTWTVVPTDCPMWTGYATAAGSLALNDAFAFDTATGTCYRLPRSPGRHLGWARRLWLGDRLLVWSGNRGEELPQTRSGYVYIPPAPSGVK